MNTDKIYAEQIANEYAPKQASKVKALRKLDAKAKADAKQTWDDAHMKPAERNAKMQEEREKQIAEANRRKEEADARYEAAKKTK